MDFVSLQTKLYLPRVTRNLVIPLTGFEIYDNFEPAKKISGLASVNINTFAGRLFLATRDGLNGLRDSSGRLPEQRKKTLLRASLLKLFNGHANKY